MIGSDVAGGGRVYFMHNTAAWLPSDPSDGVAMWGGAGSGIPNWGTYSRNNIVQGRRDDILYIGVYETPHIDPGAWDYDFANGRRGYFIVSDVFAPGAPPWNLEAHGIFGRPMFADTAFATTFALAAGTPGVDQGAVIAGFNDDFAGSAPDVGAQESGRPALQFGVNAYVGMRWYADGSQPSPSTWPAMCDPIVRDSGIDGAVDAYAGDAGMDASRGMTHAGCGCVVGARGNRREWARTLAAAGMLWVWKQRRRARLSPPRRARGTGPDGSTGSR